jgi:predicted Rossmann fold flavoprotein
MKQEVHVVGAGPAGLMAAEVLASSGLKVTIFDHQKKPARKFLLAGRGGLNLTNNMDIELLMQRYGSARKMLEPAIRAFPTEAVRAWCGEHGIQTFVGTSGRIFPVGLKSSPLLRAWLKRLEQLGVTLQSGTTWSAFDENPTILALGGASWPELGSDGSWIEVFERSGVRVNPIRPSNCRQLVSWTDHFTSRFAGSPIKNIAVTVGGRSVRGEVMITRDGIEGGAIYAMSTELRANTPPRIQIDLRPDMSEADVQRRLSRPHGKQSRSNILRKSLGLSPVSISLMRETASENPKSVKIPIAGTADIRRAISTAGGVAAEEVDPHFRLRKYSNTYVVGEMLDWDAPTGGFLLHACLATARFAAADMARRTKG